MIEDSSSEPALSPRAFRGAIRTICWGVAIASLCSLGYSSFDADSRISLDIAAIVGLAIALVGVHDLPFGPSLVELRSRRRTVVVLLVISLAANVATLVPGLDVIASATAEITRWIWQVLLLVLVGRVMSVLHAHDLARWWRRLTLVWLSLGVASLACAAVVALTSDESTASVAAVFVLTTLVLVAAVAIFIVASQTVHWLKVNAGPEPEPSRPADVVPIEARGGEPRLGRDGDRIIYYVDPHP